MLSNEYWILLSVTAHRSWDWYCVLANPSVLKYVGRHDQQRHAFMSRIFLHSEITGLCDVRSRHAEAVDSAVKDTRSLDLTYT